MLKSIFDKSVFGETQFVKKQLKGNNLTNISSKNKQLEKRKTINQEKKFTYLYIAYVAELVH